MNSIVRTTTLDRQVSADEFRGAMRQLTGGVSVITVGRGRDISGMTVTSVSSLSVEPPALIVAINRGASSWPLLKRYGVFGVNILNSDQLDIAERFAGKDGLKGGERFSGAHWLTRASGVPLLAGALIGLRHGAPSRPAVAGAIAGMVSAGLAATLYASHCTDDSPLFVATWYTLATALVTAVGALMGARVLKY